ncbi:hypothetical protein [Micromonospora aurantiaca (nom. illeg.)]|uniref:hypothetical protein n=1 Tax=Micromonospora aurantiaca (nom. illeg.) TaxID=47850 RepID=UPI001CD93EF8|nr:hypothetical protein [Micromonospora aurantiaca]
MTSAPANLLAVRNLLLTYLNVDKKTVRADDLEPAEVGIVGDVNHRGGYHCGSDRVVTNDYSVVESTRDRTGLTLHASALDVGTFSVRSGGGTHNLRTFSAWMVAQCAANAADTRDIREIIYSPDGRTVRRWDRLGRRTSGDSSHLFHTHFSFFRDSTKAGRDQTPLFRRYLTAIGMIATTKPEDDMDAKQFLTILRDPTVVAQLRAIPWQYNGRGLADNDLTPTGNISTLGALSETLRIVRAIAEKVDIDPAELEQIRAAAREGAVSAADALIDAVMAKLPPDTLTRADVEAAVRDAFAGGLAPDAG